MSQTLAEMLRDSRERVIVDIPPSEYVEKLPVQKLQATQDLIARRLAEFKKKKAASPRPSKVKTKRRAKAGPGDSYLTLIHRFPLRAIRNDRELDEAIALINELLDWPKLDEGETDYLDVLGDLVEAYEENKHPIEPASDAAMLESLLSDRGQTQLQVAATTGIANSTLSNVLHGKRQFTRDHIRRLPKHFQVDSGVFRG